MGQPSLAPGLVIIITIILTALLGIDGRISWLQSSVLVQFSSAHLSLENLATVLFTGIPKSFPRVPLLTKTISIGPVNTQRLTFVIPVVTFIFLAILVYLIDHTKMGMAMRALGRDQETASLMGVNVNSVISFTFAVGSALAAVGGVMWGLKYPSIIPFMGVMPGLKCFIAAVIGGIGSIKGAVIGGFILGLGEIFIVASVYLTGINISGYKDAFAFVLLIIILLVKPNGIAGAKTAEKV